MLVVHAFFKWSCKSRFAGAPVDFDEVTINASTSDVSSMEKALLSVKRNGVALKGKFFFQIKLIIKQATAQRNITFCLIFFFFNLNIVIYLQHILKAENLIFQQTPPHPFFYKRGYFC